MALSGISSLVAEQVTVYFLIIISGFIITKCGVIKQEDSKIISLMVVNLIIPCLLINAFQVDWTPESLKKIGIVAATNIITQFIFIFCARILSDVFKLNSVEKVSIAYSNCGNLVIPLVAVVFGKEWVIYSSVISSIQNFFLWTHMKMVITGDKKLEIKKLLLNPTIIAMLLGMVMMVFRIRFPEILGRTLGTLGDMTGPLCMLISGMLLSGLTVEKLKMFRKLPFVLFLRLIAMPAIILILIVVTKAPARFEDGQMLFLLCLIPTATQTASTVVQIAQVYGDSGDAMYASVINAVSGVLCVFTMPIFVMIYQNLLM